MDLLPAWSQACICGHVFSVSRRIHTLATCPITSRTRSLAVKLTVISLAQPTSFDLPLVTMDLFPAWSQTCVCLPQVYTSLYILPTQLPEDEETAFGSSGEGQGCLASRKRHKVELGPDSLCLAFVAFETNEDRELNANLMLVNDNR